MPDLTAVISDAISDLDTGGDGGVEQTGGDTGEVAEGSADLETGGSVADDAGAGEAAEGETATNAEAESAQRQPKRIRWAQHEKALKQAEAKWQTEIAARDERLKSLAWAEAEDTRQKLQALDIADTQPERFFNALLQDPRYGALLEARLKAVAPAPTETARTEATPPSDRPKPNVLLADGTVTYDEAGLDALLAWERARAVKEAEDRFDKRLEKFNPILEEREAREKYGEALTRQGQILNNARTKWAGFKENEAACKDWLRDAWKTDRTLGLWDAYQAVVVPRFQAERTKMREELLAEINGKAGAPIKAPASRPSKSASGGGNRSLTDIINDSIAGLE